MQIQSAADSEEVNVIITSLQKMSTAAVQETLREEVLWPFCPEALQCSNDTGRESLKYDVG